MLFALADPRATLVAPPRALALTETAAGAVIDGATSLMVTIWVAVAVNPLGSVTVQVTVVTPSGNRLGALLVMARSEVE